MLAFFYSLFHAIATGTWATYQTNYVGSVLANLGNRTMSLIVNALGGKFEKLQDVVFFNPDLNFYDVFSAISAVVALVIVCTLTFKLTKMVFSIFFGGR